jgi:hypothetical protein
MHCRYHVQFKARHGSHWHATYKAAELQPYLTVAAEWIKTHLEDPRAKYALIGLKGLLDASGRAEPAQDIKRRSAAHKARVAFARLREGGIEPARILAIHMAVAALNQDDWGSHKVAEFRLVQTAKAVHRLASGTHRHWECPMQDGTTRTIHFHAYPRSSVIVLRVSAVMCCTVKRAAPSSPNCRPQFSHRPFDGVRSFCLSSCDTARSRLS